MNWKVPDISIGKIIEDSRRRVELKPKFPINISLKDAAFEAQILRGQMLIAKIRLSTAIYNLERKKPNV